MPLTITKLRCRSAAALLGGIFVLLIPGTDNIHAQGTSAKIDQFGSINAEDAMARLDRFALELSPHPDSRGSSWLLIQSTTAHLVGVPAARLRLPQLPG